MDGVNHAESVSEALQVVALKCDRVFGHYGPPLVFPYHRQLELCLTFELLLKPRHRGFPGYCRSLIAG